MATSPLDDPSGATLLLLYRCGGAAIRRIVQIRHSGSFKHPHVEQLDREREPRSLHGAPMLLPIESLTLRRSLNQWFERHGVRPRVIAAFEDSALLEVLGADGAGVFDAPSVVEKEVVARYRVHLLGRADKVRERFYAISVERRLKHPAVVAISDAARRALFTAHR